MLFAALVVIATLSLQSIDSQGGGPGRPPIGGFGRGPPGGGLGGPGRGGGGPGGGGDAERYLSESARKCMQSCTARNLICAVLTRQRMTDTCRTCLRTQCPHKIGDPGFSLERCHITNYVKCVTSNACPTYTTTDQGYLSQCLKCRDGCIPTALKAEITKKMKDAVTCRANCRTTHGCPAPPPQSCAECTRRLCGDGRQITCVQNAFGGTCPTCRFTQSPSVDVVRKCQDCMVACEPSENRQSGKPDKPRGGAYLRSGPSPGSGRGRQGGKENGNRKGRRDGPRGRLFANLVRHLPKAAIVCLAKCPATCSDEERVNKLLEKLALTCRNCMEATCPQSAGTPHFDHVDCNYRAHTSCGLVSGCTPFTATEKNAQDLCTVCRDGCISEVLKNEVRNKMAKIDSCQAQCVTKNECPPSPNGSCRVCIQRECVVLDDDECRQRVISSGKCSSCPVQGIRRNAKCLSCLRKCRPDDEQDHPGRRSPQARKDHRPTLPAQAKACLASKCAQCDKNQSIRGFMEGRSQKCRSCTNVLCPVKDTIPSFDHDKCQHEAHGTCGMYFGCEPLSAEVLSLRSMCMKCENDCIPESVKIQIRSNMKKMSMCKASCRASSCGDKDMCEKCVDTYCENSFYKNCEELAGTSSCASCMKNPSTKQQCDKCMNNCEPAMSGSGYKPMQTGGEHRGSDSNEHMNTHSSETSQYTGSDHGSCMKSCEARGCSSNSCQDCINSVCDTSKYTDCEVLVRKHKICPSCDTETTYCQSCYAKCDATSAGSS